MRILLSNDDGVHAQGLLVLQKMLSRLGEVWTVAPLEERSTTGHSLTLHKPLRLHKIGPRFFGASGSPADCVYLGIRQVLGRMPDLVVSGINRGANLGQDIYYSGTVSAAREACMMGIPSLAVSLAIDFNSQKSEEQRHYASAAKLAVDLIREFKSKKRGGPALDLPLHTLLNLNVPDLPLSKIKGFRPAEQGFRHYGGKILRRKDHRGRDYFWVGGQYQGFKANDLSDCHWVEKGYAAITPLQLNATDPMLLKRLKLRYENDDKGSRSRK